MRALLASGVLGAFALGCVTGGGQTHMQSALDHLRAARGLLADARSSKGGHRGRAIGLVDRAISQVVTGLPLASLPSFNTTPMPRSSSRMRSDSLKSLRARAAIRTSIKRVAASESSSFCRVENDAGEITPRNSRDE